MKIHSEWMMGTNRRLVWLMWRAEGPYPRNEELLA